MAQAPTKTVKTTKRKAKSHAGIDPQAHTLDEAVKIIKSRASAKFDETVEIAMNLGVDPKYPDQQVRGVVSLPSGSGRTARVAVFAKGAKAEEAKAAGADIVGAEDLFETVNGGTIDFDRLIATPDMMASSAVSVRCSARGMMPNPKAGTVTMDVKKLLSPTPRAARLNLRRKGGIIHAPRRQSQLPPEAQLANVKAFVDAVSKGEAHWRKGVREEGGVVDDDGPRRCIDPSAAPRGPQG